MPLDKCNKCGSSFIEVKEQNYNGYDVPVLKCTSCNTIFGVANQSEEIEMLKNTIKNLEQGIKNALISYDNNFKRIQSEINKINHEIKK